jgi:hypothetical protein
MSFNQVPEVNYGRLFVGPSRLPIHSFDANKRQEMSSSL